MTMKDGTAEYKPAGPVIKAFLESPAFVRGVMGPFGSGKSTACVVEILRRAMLQAPGPDGVRRTRWAIIRNSYPELRSTTIKTWFEWCPQRYGKTNFDSPIIHHIQTSDLDMEVLFLALDRPEDQRKLLSLELTGAWINEAREVPKVILDTLTGRVGRYPGKLLGGCSWYGILMDTNPPDSQSWWYRMSEEETPDGWKFFKQPSGLSPEAENIENLPKDYYRNQIAGKDQDWIKIYIEGHYGFVVEGQAVFPMFRDRMHTASGNLEPDPHLPLLIGADFGLTPAAVIGQRLANGRWLILDEFLSEDCGIQRFAELLTSYMAQNYSDNDILGAWGDPAGDARGHDEKTALDIMRNHTPWKWRAAPGDNDLTMRLEVVRGALNRLIDGDPGLILSPKCATLRKGFTGGYHYKLVKSGNGTQTHEKPNKNEYSHPHDALQYLLLGGGEHDVVLNKVRRSRDPRKPNIAKNVDFPIFGSKKTDFNPFRRKY